MINEDRTTCRKPDSLMLLGLFVALAAVVTTAVGGSATGTAGRLFDDLGDGDVRVMHIGRKGPAVHLSLQEPPQARRDTGPGAASGRRNTLAPDVYLSLGYPW